MHIATHVEWFASNKRIVTIIRQCYISMMILSLINIRLSLEINYVNLIQVSRV